MNKVICRYRIQVLEGQTNVWLPSEHQILRVSTKDNVPYLVVLHEKDAETDTLCWITMVKPTAPFELGAEKRYLGFIRPHNIDTYVFVSIDLGEC